MSVIALIETVGAAAKGAETLVEKAATVYGASKERSLAELQGLQAAINRGICLLQGALVAELEPSMVKPLEVELQYACEGLSKASANKLMDEELAPTQFARIKNSIEGHVSKVSQSISFLEQLTRTSMQKYSERLCWIINSKLQHSKRTQFWQELCDVEYLSLEFASLAAAVKFVNEYECQKRILVFPVKSVAHGTSTEHLLWRADVHLDQVVKILEKLHRTQEAAAGEAEETPSFANEAAHSVPSFTKVPPLDYSFAGYQEDHEFVRHLASPTPGDFYFEPDDMMRGLTLDSIVPTNIGSGGDIFRDLYFPSSLKAGGEVRVRNYEFQHENVVEMKLSQMDSIQPTGSGSLGDEEICCELSESEYELCMDESTLELPSVSPIAARNRVLELLRIRDNVKVSEEAQQTWLRAEACQPQEGCFGSGSCHFSVFLYSKEEARSSVIEFQRRSGDALIFHKLRQEIFGELDGKDGLPPKRIWESLPLPLQLPDEHAIFEQQSPPQELSSAQECIMLPFVTTKSLAPLLDALHNHGSRIGTEPTKQDEDICTDVVSSLRLAVQHDQSLAVQICCQEVASSLMQVEKCGLFSRSFGAAYQAACLLVVLAASQEVFLRCGLLAEVATQIGEALGQHGAGALIQAQLDKTFSSRRTAGA